MTKHPVEETALKCNVTVEAGKVGEGHALVICGAPVDHVLEDKLGISSRRNVLKFKRMRLGKIMPELYNLEDCGESEKPVKIDLDLDLYQMEKV